MNTVFAQSRSEKTHNEDAFVCAEGFWMVADGASALGFGDYLQTGSDAAWFARSLCEKPEDYLDYSRPLEELLKKRIYELAEVFGRNRLNQGPSAALAMLRFNPHTDALEYLILADCVLIVESGTEILRLTDPAVSLLDGKVIAHMQKIAQASGRPFLEARKSEDIGRLLQENRARKNTSKPDGYACADLLADWPYAVMGSLPARSVGTFVLFSDGFDQIGELTGLSDTALMEALKNNPAELMDELYTLQEDDADCIRLPRLKKRDDTTLLVVQ